MKPVRIHEGWGHSQQNYFCDTMQCFYEEKWTACKYWHFTLHLRIFSGGKALINLHTTPKLTVVMPINCLLRSIQFPSPQNDDLCLFSCHFVVCFHSSPAIKPFLELTDCCLVYPTFFLQFVFAFFNHSIKIAQFLFAGGHFFSFPSHFDRWCFSSPM